MKRYIDYKTGASKMSLFRRLVDWLLSETPYEIRKKLPSGNLKNVQLALAYYYGLNPNVTFVQIGACDGVSNDPIFDFVYSGKIRAVLVEPVEDSYHRLKKAYSGVLNAEIVQAAIAEQDGNSTLYKVKNAGRWKNCAWARQWASFNKQHLIKHGVKPSEIEEIIVPCLNLSSLMAKFNFSKIDFLQIDTEGYDATIVEMALNLPIPPGCINFENAHLSRSTKEHLFRKLREAGYSWAHDGGDTLALHHTIIQLWKQIAFIDQPV